MLSTVKGWLLLTRLSMCVNKGMCVLILIRHHTSLLQVLNSCDICHDTLLSNPSLTLAIIGNFDIKSIVLHFNVISAVVLHTCSSYSNSNQTTASCCGRPCEK